jgi:hypothetical protein
MRRSYETRWKRKFHASTKHYVYWSSDVFVCLRFRLAWAMSNVSHTTGRFLLRTRPRGAGYDKKDEMTKWSPGMKPHTMLLLSILTLFEPCVAANAEGADLGYLGGRAMAQAQSSQDEAVDPNVPRIASIPCEQITHESIARFLGNARSAAGAWGIAYREWRAAAWDALESRARECQMIGKRDRWRLDDHVAGVRSTILPRIEEEHRAEQVLITVEKKVQESLADISSDEQPRRTVERLEAIVKFIDSSGVAMRDNVRLKELFNDRLKIARTAMASADAEAARQEAERRRSEQQERDNRLSKELMAKPECREADVVMRDEAPKLQNDVVLQMATRFMAGMKTEGCGMAREIYSSAERMRSALARCQPMLAIPLNDLVTQTRQLMSEHRC